MWRTGAQGLRLGGTVAQALTDHAWLSARGAMSLPARAEWLHRWCQTCLRRLEVEYTYEGLVPRNALLVSNHVSYLDILVLSAITPCVFVAKKEVAQWPVFGRMARLSGTIFVDRTRRADVHRVGEQIAEAAKAGVIVVLFPEGGSSNGKTVLPFYSSLLEPAVQRQLPVTPVYLSYSLRDGNPETDICYWGDMTLAPHAAKLLSRHEVRARLRFGDARLYADRKQAAAETRRDIMRLGELVRDAVET